MTEAAIPNLERQICPTCSAIYGSAYDLCPNDGTLLVPGGGDELLGSTLAGKYVIDACIGEGGMGRVYRAHHARLKKRTFALKILRGDLSADPTMRKRFEQEAESASRLQHPNVVSVLDFGKTDAGLLYLVMEFVDGRDLAEVIKDGPIPEQRVIAITKELCLGLAHAHQEGLVHRDFKPDNVVLAEQDQGATPRILDFGLAIVRSSEEASVRLTGSGLMVGTPAYISPEQARAVTVDQRTDLFSLGVTVYEMLSGKLPFDGDAIEIMYANTKLDAPPIAERNAAVSVSAALEAIVRKLMARNPDERFQSASEVVTLLGALAEVDKDPEADASLRELLATQVSEELEDQGLPTVKNGLPVVADTIRDVPAVAPGPRSKTKTLMLAVFAVLVSAVALFALFNSGGSDSQTSEKSLQAESAEGPTAEALALPAPDATETTALRPPDPVSPKAKEDPTPVDRVGDPPPSLEQDDKVPTQDEIRAKRKQRERDLARRAKRRSESPGAPREEGKDEPSADPTPPPKTTTEEAPLPKPAPPDPVVAVVPAPPVSPRPTPPPAPQVFDAQTRIQSFSARGSLSSRVVRRAVDRALPAIRKCYKTAATKSKKNKLGTLALSFRIDELGRASNVKVASYSLPGLTKCVSKGIRSVKTRVAPDVGTVSVSLELKFVAK